MKCEAVGKPRFGGLRRKEDAQAGVPVPLKAQAHDEDGVVPGYQLRSAGQKSHSSRKQLPEKLQIVICLAVRLRRMLCLAGVEVGAMVEVGD
jgi:hypothetical protein